MRRFGKCFVISFLLAGALLCGVSAQAQQSIIFGEPVTGRDSAELKNLITISKASPPRDVAKNAELFVASGYEAKGEDKSGEGARVKVTVDRPGKSVVLVIGSIRKLLWEVVATPQTRIRAILVMQNEGIALQMATPAPAYTLAFQGVWNDPGSFEFIRFQEFVYQELGVRRLAGANVKYTMPAAIEFRQVDPSPLMEPQVPTVRQPSIDLEFLVYGRGRSGPLARWALDGPRTALDGYAPTVRRIYPLSRQAISRDGERTYRFGSGGLHSIELKTGEEKVLPFPPNFPSDWPTGIAFDTRRNILSAISLSGDGYLYRLDAATGKWIDYRSVKGIDVVSLAYDDKADRYVGLTSYGELLLINSAGETGTVSKRILESLENYSYFFRSEGYQQDHVFTLIPSGDYVALVHGAGEVIDKIWEYNMITKVGRLTYWREAPEMSKAAAKPPNAGAGGK